MILMDVVKPGRSQAVTKRREGAKSSPNRPSVAETEAAPAESLGPSVEVTARTLTPMTFPPLRNPYHDDTAARSHDEAPFEFPPLRNPFYDDAGGTSPRRVRAARGKTVDSSTEPLDERPVRTYARGQDGTARLVVAPRASSVPAPPTHGKVSAATLTARLSEASAARREQLRNLSTAPRNARITLEDGSERITGFKMTYDGSDICTTPLISAMSQIGQIEGFSVVVASGTRSLAERLTPEARANVHVVSLPGERDPWTEDHGDLSADGTVSIPARVNDKKLIERAVAADRIRRFYGVEPPSDLGGSDISEVLSKKYPLCDFLSQGSVDSGRTYENMAALAVATDAPLRENLTYTEGGNILAGRRADGTTYALVGRDTLAISKAVLERDTGRPVSDDEVRSCVARDCGVDRVHPVEQPGAFHIDTRMCIVGPNRVVLHDSMEAFRLHAKWMREDFQGFRPHAPPADAPRSAWNDHAAAMKLFHRQCQDCERDLAELEKEARKRQTYEDRALIDLKAAGFKVERMAAVFNAEGHEHVATMNFVNLEQGTNTRGERYMILNGGDPRAERYAAHRLLDELQVDAARLHFLPREASMDSLRRLGGINCRAKAEVAPAS